MVLQKYTSDWNWFSKSMQYLKSLVDEEKNWFMSCLTSKNQTEIDVQITLRRKNAFIKY